MYQVYESCKADLETPSNILAVAPVQGFEQIPEDDIEDIINIFRLEGRTVYAVRDIETCHPFEAPPRNIGSILRPLLFFGLVLSGGFLAVYLQYMPMP